MDVIFLVKCFMFVEGADRKAKVELLEELELMKKVGCHPNVVKLLGYCIETGKPCVTHCSKCYLTHIRDKHLNPMFLRTRRVIRVHSCRYILLM